MAASRPTVLIARSDCLGWSELRAALDALPGIALVGDVAEPVQALEAAERERPNVILCGSSPGALVPLVSGLRRACPASAIVVFATRIDIAELTELVRVGINGYLYWPDLTRASLTRLLLALLDDHVVVSSESVLDAVQAALAASGGSSSELAARERAVLVGLAAGLSRDEIARQEGISPRTVDRIVTRLEQRLGASSLFGLGIRVAELGLLS